MQKLLLPHICLLYTLVVLKEAEERGETLTEDDIEDDVSIIQNKLDEEGNIIVNEKNLFEKVYLFFSLSLSFLLVSLSLSLSLFQSPSPIFLYLFPFRLRFF